MRRKLTICLIAAILGPLFAEGFVRVMGMRTAPRPVIRGTLCRPSEDPELGHVPIPGARQVVEYPGDRGEPAWKLVLEVNPQGFRGPPVEAKKPPGVRRIVCLGDSHTFGYGVAAEEAWPGCLDSALAARAPGRFEVVNAGVPSFDTAQTIRWLETRVLQLDPDVVVLQYFVNDAMQREADDPRIKRTNRLLSWTSPNRKDWVRELRDRSRLADLVLDGTWRWVIERELTREDWAVRGSDDPGWLRTQSALGRARAFAAEHELRMGVALFPLMVRRGKGFASHAAFAQVAEFCAAEGIPCRDTEADLLGCERLTVSRTDLHASSEAHAAFAAAVLAWLDELGWLEE